MKNVGIYGGAFDPPHLSHVLAVGYALSKGNFNQIIVMPCWLHAFDKDMLSFDKRMEMCRRAFNIYDPRTVSVSDAEAELKTQYSIDLITFLTERYKNTNFSLIIGDDEYNNFNKWHEYKKILSLASLFVIPRTEGQIKMPNVSSNQIRKDIRDKGLNSIRHLVSESVYECIKENNFYMEK